MSMQDIVSDLLTRIRNGQIARKEVVSMPSSKLKEVIVKVLENEGYVVGYKIDSDDSKKLVLKIFLKYFEGKPVITAIKRMSRPSLRIYSSVQELPKVLGGLGILIISTNKGVMSDSQARKLGVGGEILCTVE